MVQITRAKGHVIRSLIHYCMWFVHIYQTCDGYIYICVHCRTWSIRIRFVSDISPEMLLEFHQHHQQFEGWLVTSCHHKTSIGVADEVPEVTLLPPSQFVCWFINVLTLIGEQTHDPLRPFDHLFGWNSHPILDFWGSLLKHSPDRPQVSVGLQPHDTPFVTIH